MVRRARGNRNRRVAETLARRVCLLITKKMPDSDQVKEWADEILRYIRFFKSDEELYSVLNWFCAEYDDRFRAIRSRSAFEKAIPEIIKQCRDSSRYTVPDTVKPVADMVLRDLVGMDKQDGRALFFDVFKWVQKAATAMPDWYHIFYLIGDTYGCKLCYNGYHRFASAYLFWVWNKKSNLSQMRWDGKVWGYWSSDPAFLDFLDWAVSRFREGQGLTSEERVAFAVIE